MLLLALILSLPQPSFAVPTTENLSSESVEGAANAIVLNKRKELLPTSRTLIENQKLNEMSKEIAIANLPREIINHDDRNGITSYDRYVAYGFADNDQDIALKITLPCEATIELAQSFMWTLILGSPGHYKIFTAPQWTKYGFKAASEQKTTSSGDCTFTSSVSIHFAK